MAIALILLNYLRISPEASPLAPPLDGKPPSSILHLPNPELQLRMRIEGTATLGYVDLALLPPSSSPATSMPY